MTRPPATASCCASFGELLQGELPLGGHFLVTLPIDLHTLARFSVAVGEREWHVEPAYCWKAGKLAEALLARHRLPRYGRLEIASAIPVAKGLASSTADLIATYRAVTAWHGLPDSVQELESLLCAIEPSDGLMHAGIVAYLHREARLHAQLVPAPALTLVAIDEGGGIDTLAYNVRYGDYGAQEREEYASLLARLAAALRSGDIAEVGAIATRSAQLNQHRLPKRWLTTLVNLSIATESAGVVAAHSGTYLAIMIDANGRRHDAQVATCRGELAGLGLVPRIYRSLQPTRDVGNLRFTGESAPNGFLPSMAQ
jgi:L-threonine kinase